MNLIHLKERIAISADYTPQERDFLLEAVNAAADAHRPMVAHDPGNYLGRIDAIYAALSLDDDGEGVCAAPMGGMTVPLIAADKQRLVSIRPIAAKIAKLFKKPVRIVKFTKREEIEIFQP